MTVISETAIYFPPTTSRLLFFDGKSFSCFLQSLTWLSFTPNCLPALLLLHAKLCKSNYLKFEGYNIAPPLLGLALCLCLYLSCDVVVFEITHRYLYSSPLHLNNSTHGPIVVINDRCVLLRMLTIGRD